jgi:CRISPR/Cas system CMR subunit Cmr4 (Cas7 group RAMP superfamily)
MVMTAETKQNTSQHIATNLQQLSGYQPTLLRIHLLSNANLGSTSGRAILDRPTQVDAIHELPYVPNSALRGVIREGWNHQVNKVFGSRKFQRNLDDPDDTPGKLFIGNGDLLAFPLHTIDGERCWVFPRITIAKLLFLFDRTDYSDLLAVLNSGGYHHTVLAIPEIPELPVAVDLRQVPTSHKPTADHLFGLLQHLSGNIVRKTDYLLVVDEKLAVDLWRLAAEVRTQTRLSKEKAAEDGSLRTVETVPEGSIFLSLMEWREQGSLPFPKKIIQVGSGEGGGLGFCQIALTEFSIPQNGTSTLPRTLLTKAVKAVVVKADMTNMFAAIENVLPPKRSDAFRKKLRTAILDFGSRMHREGFSAAIAFCFAKAKLNAKNRSAEAQAYEYLVKLLLEKSTIDNDEMVQQMSAAPAKVFQHQVMYRWQWLRRFAEFELLTSEGETP